MPTSRHFLRGIRSSLTQKLIFVSLAATLVPVVCWGVYIYGYSMRNVEREYLDSIANNLRQLDYNFMNQVNASRQTALSFAGETNLIEFLQFGTEDDYSMVNIVTKSILPRLQTALTYNPGFHTVRLIHRNPKIPIVTDHLYYDVRFEQGWWKRYLNSLPGNSGQPIRDYFVDVMNKESRYGSYGYAGTGKDRVFALYFPVYSTYTLEMLGVFEITIEEDEFLKPLRELDAAKGTELMLIGSDNRSVYSTDSSYAGMDAASIAGAAENASYRAKGRNYFVVKLFIPELDCWLVQYVPEVLIYQSSAYRSLIVFGLLAVLLTTASLSYVVFKLLLSNLNTLTRTIRRISRGDLGATVEVTSEDEIGELAREFNEMTQKVRELLQQVEASGRAEKEAVYKALENQISPHFICNALDAIRMTAEMQSNRQIADATGLISSYFMYNIYRRSKEVSLTEELRNVTDYLDIHNLIRRERIEYVIRLSPDISGQLDYFRIMKFSLQPIIENAVKHGFKDRYSHCLIVIAVSLEDSRIRIAIEDNGIGLGQERLLRVRASLNGGPETDTEASGAAKLWPGGIGLHNIKERFELNYGNRYVFDFASYEGVGTKVTIEIPA